MANEKLSATPSETELEAEQRRRAILEYLDELDQADPLTESDWAEVERRLRAIER